MKFLKLLVICFLIVSCQVRHDYKITGNVQGLPDSAVIDLYVQYGNMGSRVSSDTVINGQFSFSDSIGDEILNMNLAMRDMQKYLGMCNLWVGRADIEVSGTGKYLSAWKVKSNIKEQKDENRILDLIGNFNVLRDSLYQVQMLNYQNNIDDKGMIQSKVDSINKIQSDIELKYLKNNYNSKISVMHLCRLAQFGDSLQKAEIKEFYLKIDTTYLNTLWGEGIGNYLNKVVPPKVGDKFVNIKAFDIENKSHQLSDYVGKYILLDFWSMGCYPCILSIPELRKLSANYKNDLVVIGLSMDTKKKFWIEATKKDSITWINLSDGKGTFGGASYLYGIDGFPTYILINQEGFIVDRWMGFWSGVFDEKISKYMKDKE
jgi:peroxiredoxin